MFQWRKLQAVVLAALIVSLSAQVSYAESILLKKGMSNDAVRVMQNNLKSLGFFMSEPTGYFGGITLFAVENFQKRNNLVADGIAGNQTLGRINSFVESTPVASRGNVSRGDTYQKSQVVMLPWFEKVSKIFKRGDIAKVTDVSTGLSYSVKRTYGTNHADVEAVTARDTAVLKKIAGGEWNWTRRAVIVEAGGYRIAASMTARPHAGRDDKPAGVVVTNRSGDYGTGGTGTNFDEIKGNKMDGHFDIHFLNSRTHNTNKVDAKHQQMVKKAYNSDK